MFKEFFKKLFKKKEPVKVLEKVGYKPQDMSKYEGIPEQKLPLVWYPFYVIYQYSFSKSEFIVGFDSQIKAEEFKASLSKNKDTVRVELVEDYPPDLLKKGLK